MGLESGTADEGAILPRDIDSNMRPIGTVIRQLDYFVNALSQSIATRITTVLSATQTDRSAQLVEFRSIFITIQRYLAEFGPELSSIIYSRIREKVAKLIPDLIQGNFSTTQLPEGLLDEIAGIEIPEMEKIITGRYIQSQIKSMGLKQGQVAEVLGFTQSRLSYHLGLESSINGIFAGKIVESETKLLELCSREGVANIYILHDLIADIRKAYRIN